MSAGLSRLNLDMAFQKVGEYGRAQWLLTFVLSLARNAQNYIYYSFAYLVLEQRYVCQDEATGEFVSCSRDSICQAPETPVYRVDTEYEYYLRNWFV